MSYARAEQEGLPQRIWDCAERMSAVDIGHTTHTRKHDIHGVRNLCTSFHHTTENLIVCGCKGFCISLRVSPRGIIPCKLLTIVQPSRWRLPLWRHSATAGGSGDFRTTEGETNRCQGRTSLDRRLVSYGVLVRPNPALGTARHPGRAQCTRETRQQRVLQFLESTQYIARKN
jgi:hypothetical protein